MGELKLKIATVIASVILLLSLSTSLYYFYKGDNNTSMFYLYPTVGSMIIVAFLMSTKPLKAKKTEEDEHVEP
jgi:hypothetical protein